MKVSFTPPSDERLIITQRNELAYAAYEMSIQEKRLLMLAIARLTKSNLELPCWEIPVSQIADYLGIRQNNVYRDVKNVAMSLMSRVALIPEEDKGYILIQFVSRCRYIPATRHPSENAVLEIKLHDEMAPYLLQLKSHFQSIQFIALAGLSSFYAIRMYEILHHARNEQGMPRNEVTISMEELRKTLKLEKKYQNYADFRIRVLETAKTQINARTPLGMSYKELRARSRGAPVRAIEFTIWDQTSPAEAPVIDAQLLMEWGEKSIDEQKREVFKVLERHIDFNAFRGLVGKLEKEGHRWEKIQANLELAACQIAKNPESVKNIVRYCIDAVVKNWARV